MAPAEVATPRGSAYSERADAEPARAGVVLASRYRLERILGRGGIGEVWAATHLDLDQRVAVKLLRPDVLSTIGVQRFRREARLTALLRSDHVCHVRDWGSTTRGAPFLVMELLSGSDLATALRDRGRFSVEEAAGMIVQACHALAEAHAAGCIHRDIKPSNLFLDVVPGGASRLKVIDFGIAKARAGTITSARLTAESAFLGSPHYMSPEQIEDPSQVDARTDVWALGVVLHELLTGERPFDCPDTAELLRKISADAAPPPRGATEDIPGALVEIVASCLEKDLDRRIRSVVELARRLRPFASPRDQLLVDSIVSMADLTRRDPPGLAPAPAERGGTKVDSESDGVLPAGADGPGEEDPEIALAPRAIRAGYQTIRVLGRGAMGIVYEARAADGKPFALKVLAMGNDAADTLKRRLVSEARAASLVSSPYVVKIHDTGMDQLGSPFIVMELLKGNDLERTLLDAGPLNPTVVAKLFCQACEGLSAAHERKLVHRDIKPANLFLHTAEDGEITVKICDFGIVKTTETLFEDPEDCRLTRTGYSLGSPLYMSPEQARTPRDVDERTDIWSLCMSMYEVLSGYHPWSDCRSPAEIIVALWTQDVRPLQSVAPWVDEGLAVVVHRGLRRDPADRWSSAEELSQALLPFCGADLRLRNFMIVPADRVRVRRSEPGLSQAARSAPVSPILANVGG